MGLCHRRRNSILIVRNVLVPVDSTPIVADSENVLFEHTAGQIACVRPNGETENQTPPCSWAVKTASPKQIQKLAASIKETGRRAYAMELDTRYADVSLRRWQEFTGKTAIYANTGQSFVDLEQERSAVSADPGGKQPLGSGKTGETDHV
jgi:hypothetical protein